MRVRDRIGSVKGTQIRVIFRVTVRVMIRVIRYDHNSSKSRKYWHVDGSHCDLYHQPYLQPG